MSQKVRPFNAGSWFPIHNAAFDVIMPRLSPNGWKVLCVAIRQTWGWVADSGGDSKDRKAWDRISYSQFREKAGIASDATVRRALVECLETGYLLRYQKGTYRGEPSYIYALNRDYEIDLPTGTETVQVTATEVTATDSVDTKQRKQTKQRDGGDGSSEGITLLTALGVSEPVAKKLARKCVLDDVQAWVSYAEGAKGLRDPVGLVVARLRDGEPAPPASRDGDGKRGGLVTAICPGCYHVLPAEHICPDCGRCGECCECEEVEP